MLPISTVLDSAGLEVLVHKEATLPPGETSRGIELVAVTAPRYFELLVSKDQQAISRVTTLLGIINADHQEEARLLLSNGRQGVISLAPS